MSSRGEGRPLFVRALEVLLRIYARPDRLVDQRDAHRHSGRQRPKLLEPLDLLQGIHRQRHPAAQRVARVRVDADVLPARGRAAFRRRARSRRNGIGAREKYIARPSSPATTFTTFGSAQDVARSEHRRGSEREA